ARSSDPAGRRQRCGDPAASQSRLGGRRLEARRRRRWAGAMNALWRWETLLFALVLAVAALNPTYSPYYRGVSNFINLFQLSIEKSIVALAMAFVIIGAEIDLSVASVM